jgi:protein-disulfide isomerase
MSTSSRLVRVGFALWMGASACDQNNLAPSTAPPRPAVAPVAQKVAERAPAAGDLFKVPLGDSPARGAAEPKVTIVAFSEFQCPFCARVLPTVEQVLRTYGDDVRLVWKHLPLPFHNRAVPAALAAEAAGAQGKFWPMHDKLFAHQAELGAEDFKRHAASLGLDLARFEAALASEALRARVEADRQLAQALGVNGTPSFFVNGRKLVGAQPWDKWKALIDAELTRADQKLASGVPRARLYAALTEAGLDQAPSRPVAEGPGGAGPCARGECGKAVVIAPSADSEVVHKIDLGDSPSRGPKDAPVTLVVFSDFQCPFCSKIEPTVQALEQAYPGKLRVVWKNFPLDFHADARLAAAAALAAHAQGKFWAMHDKLFAQQQQLGRAHLEGYAREVGLDLGRWQAALEAQAAVVESDVKQGSALGVQGTPTVFVNGRKVVGARPVAAFKTIIDEELRKRGG